jgi:hypothetical protein
MPSFVASSLPHAYLNPISWVGLGSRYSGQDFPCAFFFATQLLVCKRQSQIVRKTTKASWFDGSEQSLAASSMAIQHTSSVNLNDELEDAPRPSLPSRKTVKTSSSPSVLSPTMYATCRTPSCHGNFEENRPSWTAFTCDAVEVDVRTPPAPGMECTFGSLKPFRLPSPRPSFWY